MDRKIYFDYYYGDESSQFSFYRIPRQLITGSEFKRLSTDAKLLYGLFLDRMGLSARNNWYDPQGRVFIYYTLDEIQEDLNCSHEKAVKLLGELDTGKGIGLIERIKQGQGKPAKIYVKRFTTRAIPPETLAPQEVPRLRKIGSADFGKSDASYIKFNQTEFNYTDPSIHPSPSIPRATPEKRLMDRYEYQKEVREAINFDALCRQYDRDEVAEVVELMTDVLMTTCPTIRIGGEDIPAAQAKERFSRLNQEHLEYVFDCLRRNSTEIRNIRAYLLTALYNAPSTLNSHYRAVVQHDLGP